MDIFKEACLKFSEEIFKLKAEFELDILNPEIEKFKNNIILLRLQLKF